MPRARGLPRRAPGPEVTARSLLAIGALIAVAAGCGAAVAFRVLEALHAAGQG